MLNIICKIIGHKYQLYKISWKQEYWHCIRCDKDISQLEYKYKDI